MQAQRIACVILKLGQRPKPQRRDRPKEETPWNEAGPRRAGFSANPVDGSTTKLKIYLRKFENDNKLITILR